MNEKVKSILKNKNYKGSKKGYYLFILILTALYGATILYTYIHEGKIWISGGPVEKDIVYIFSTVIYIFSLLLSLSALKSVLPNIKKFLQKNLAYKIAVMIHITMKVHNTLFISLMKLLS